MNRSTDDELCPNCGRLLSECNGNCIFFAVRADHKSFALVRYPDTEVTVVSGLTYELAAKAAKILNRRIQPICETE